MTEHGNARQGTEPYSKPEVYALGSVRELTSWTKFATSADAWQQHQGTPHDDSMPEVTAH